MPTTCSRITSGTSSSKSRHFYAVSRTDSAPSALSSPASRSLGLERQQKTRADTAREGDQETKKGGFCRLFYLHPPLAAPNSTAKNLRRASTCRAAMHVFGIGVID